MKSEDIFPFLCILQWNLNQWLCFNSVHFTLFHEFKEKCLFQTFWFFQFEIKKANNGLSLTGDPKLCPISWAKANFATVDGSSLWLYAKLTTPVLWLLQTSPFWLPSVSAVTARSGTSWYLAHTPPSSAEKQKRKYLIQKTCSRKVLIPIKKPDL